ncbi:MAG: hypothetical protein Q4D98_02395 [Planctomycetia bacterium]|nr:hypothetical protein [Planctomycetia bacterium]
MATENYKNLITILNPAPSGAGGLILQNNDKSLADAVETLQGITSGIGGFSTETIADASPNLSVQDGKSYQLTHSAIETITLTLTSGTTLFRVELIVGATPPEWILPTNVICVGDDCENGIMDLLANTRYSLTGCESSFGFLFNVMQIPVSEA